jgi:acyl carrier protein
MPENPPISALAQLIRTSARVRHDLAIAPEARLVEDLGIDSLDLVGVFVKIQDEFGVEIDDADVPNLARVSDLAAYIAARSSTAAA